MLTLGGDRARAHPAGRRAAVHHHRVRRRPSGGRGRSPECPQPHTPSNRMAPDAVRACPRRGGRLRICRCWRSRCSESRRWSASRVGVLPRRNEESSACVGALAAGALSIVSPVAHADRAEPPPLYGYYNVFIDFSKQTFNGMPTPMESKTFPVLFTTHCDVNGCVATHGQQGRPMPAIQALLWFTSTDGTTTGGKPAVSIPTSVIATTPAAP